MFAILAVAALPLVFGLAMTRGLSHDEHQHIAAGMLWGHQGLLPYRDFPLFHPPYLTFVYGVIFRLTSYPVLVAREFAAVCATTLVALIGTMAYRVFRPRGSGVAWRMAIGATVLCLAADLFTQGAGRAWNLEPSLLLTVCSFLSLERGLASQRRGWLALAGGLLGLAIGTRITYAPLIAPLGLTTLLGGAPWPQRLRAATAFSAGLLAGLAGLFFLYAMDPEAFMFGNFGFAQANIDYRMATGEPRTMTLLKKLRFFWKIIMRADVGLFIATLSPLVFMAWQVWRKQATWPPVLRRLALATPFLFWGVLAPSPVFPQYFFALLPFLVLGSIWAMAALPAGSKAARWSMGLSLVGLVVAIATFSREYEGLRDLFKPREWVPFEIQKKADALHGHVTSGRVLTLAPIYPLEAGLEIDPAFATGAFGWRIAPYIDPIKAEHIGLPTPTTLNEYLAAHPPSAVMTGFEEKGEELLIEYAKKRGFVVTPLNDEERLWTPPQR